MIKIVSITNGIEIAGINFPNNSLSFHLKNDEIEIYLSTTKKKILSSNYLEFLNEFDQPYSTAQEVIDDLLNNNTTPGGGGTDPALEARVLNLENNEYKITYWQTISASSGTITKPTDSTIILDSFMEGVDAIVETITNGQPSGFAPVTAGGSYVTVSSFDTSGNYVLSGTPSSFDVALLFIITIKEINIQNLTTSNVITSEPIKEVVQSITNGDTTHAPSSEAVYEALLLKASLDSPVFTTNITTPKIIGGTAVGSQLILQGTSGNGTSTVATIVGNVGNNGATNAFNVYNSGQFLIGTSTLPGGSLSLVRIGSGTNLLDIGSYNGSNIGIWANQATPNTSNPLILANATQTYLNASTNLFLTIGVNTKIRIDNTFVNIERPTYIGTVAGSLPTAMLQVISTTEQFRLQYDVSNYYSTTIGSSGGVTFDAVGSGALFTWLDSKATTLITSTTTSTDVIETLTNNSSGTPAANYGLSRSIKLKSSTTDSQDAALEKFYWQTSTHATRKSAYALQLVHNGVLQDVFKIDYGSSSTTPEFRFIANSGNYARLQFMAGATAKGIVECFNDFYYITQTSGGAHYWLAGNYGAGMNLTTTQLTLDSGVNLKVGGAGAASAAIHVVKTTEQVRIGYDVSNYYSTTVGSTGGVTFNAVGSGASFTFSDNVINDALMRLKGYTVATLPAGTQGDVAFVTDALAPTFLAIIAGGGAIVTKVFYNGTNWVAG